MMLIRSLTFLLVGLFLFLSFSVAWGQTTGDDEDAPPFATVSAAERLTTGRPLYIATESSFIGERGRKTELKATLYTKKKGDTIPLPNREVRFLIRWYKKAYPSGKYDKVYKATTNDEGIAKVTVHVPKKANRGSRTLRVEFSGDAIPVNEELYTGTYRNSRILVN